MGYSIFPAASAGGNSNLTVSDLTTNSASVGRMTKQATYNNTQTGLTYPSGVSWVYATVIGGGGGGMGIGSGSYGNTYAPGGQAAGASFGITRATSKVTIGAGGNAGSSAGNSEFDKGGGAGGVSIYGSIIGPGGGGGFSYYNGNMTGNHVYGFSSLGTGRTVTPAIVSTNTQPNTFSGETSLHNYSDTNSADIYAWVANGATGTRADTSVRNNNNWAAGLPTNIGGFNGGARSTPSQISTNVWAPIRGGGGAGHVGNGGAASNNAGGSGGSGGGGGGGAGPGNNYDTFNGNNVNSAHANGGAGGPGVVELYY
jgi:hypothetical protein